MTDTTSIRSMLLRIMKNAISAMVRGSDELGGVTDANASTPSASSLVVGILKMAWSASTFGLLGFFLLSTIEQVAQHHAKTLWKQKLGRKMRQVYAR